MSTNLFYCIIDMTLDNGCSATQSVDIGFTPAPTLSYTSTSTTCNAANGSIDLTVSGGTSPFGYNWSNGTTNEDAIQLAAGIYSVTTTDINGCTATASVTVSAIAPGIMSVSGVEDSICAGSTFTVTALGASSYQWNPSLGLSCDTCNTTSITPTQNTTYSLIGTDANGCIDTLSFVVAAMPYANELSVHEAYIGCNPYKVDLECEPQNAIEVQWWFSNGASAIGANATLTFNTGIYDAMLVTISPYGCNDTLFFASYITVLEPPVAAFVVEGIVVNPTIPPITFDFTNLSTEGAHYDWYFGDGTNDTVTNPLHTFPEPGFYDVMLIATNNGGCADTAWRQLEVEVPHNLFVPNTFTPNGDGQNDYFTVYGDGIRRFHLRIYDRWGEKVFDSADGLSYWDGVFQNHPLNTAVFIYVADIELLDGITEQRIGDITLLR